jgi:hypothetical protein
MMESMKLAQDLEAAREAVKSLPPMQAELRAAKLRRAYPALTSLVRELSSNPKALKAAVESLPES